MSQDQRVWVSSRDIPPREGRVVLVGSREIALFNLGDRFLAIDNRCPHKGGPLADGIMAGQSIVCPLHAWKVNLETGAVERPAGEPACVQTYRTTVDGDIVAMQIPSQPAVLTLIAPADHVCSHLVTESRVG